MSDDQFTKLFTYMNERFDKLDAELAKKANREDVERIYELVDGIARRLDEDETERAAIAAQLNRHERWHHQTADKLGMKLDYDASA